MPPIIYSEFRTHRSLHKDAPVHLAIRHVGRIVSVPASACREASFPLSDLSNEMHGDEICSSVPGPRELVPPGTPIH
jgi:hypothetical protein